MRTAALAPEAGNPANTGKAGAAASVGRAGMEGIAVA
jgi:hypothetical protein